MQEYYVAKQLANSPAELLKRFKDDNNTWRETLKLWCGLADDATQMVSNIFEIEPIIAFECLADARSIEPEVSDRIIKHFDKLLMQTTPNITEIEKAFGVLASDLRPRGKQILATLKAKLNKSKNKEEITVIGNALSYTYLPEAANIIATHYKFCGSMHDILVRMGDIAVPAFFSIAKTVNINSLYGLKQIATPNAAKSLVDLIWEDNKTAIRASWLLSDLIKTPNIEQVLRNYSLTKQQKSLLFTDWVWQPFNEPANSALPLITGRIVYLINSKTKIKIKYDLEIDKRIAVPLAIVDEDLKNIQLNEDRFLFSNAIAKKEKEEFKKLSPIGRRSFFKYTILNHIKSSAYIKNKTTLLLNLVEQDKNKLLCKLPKSFAFKLLEALFVGRNATKEDWKNIFKPINYDFDTGWHYRVIFLIFTLLNISSLGYCIYILWNADFVSAWNIIQLVSCVIVVFNYILFTFFDVFDAGYMYKYPEAFLVVGVLGLIIIPIVVVFAIIDLIRIVFGRTKIYSDITTDGLKTSSVISVWTEIDNNLYIK